MTILLGLAVIALWTWTVIILIKKTKDTTNLEKIVLIASTVLAVLYVIGTAGK